MLKLTTHSEVVDTILRVVNTSLFTVTRNDKRGYTSIMSKNAGIQPALCVHTDTINNIHPEAIEKKGDVWRNADHTKLLGADDRAGCYIVKELLTRNYTGYHYLIFDLEEVGGIGSSNYASINLAYVQSRSISCFIGLDRLGSMEMALYGAESEEFVEAITEEHWKFTSGTFTDASNLAYDLNRCCVNLSVGYDNEHSRYEQLNLSYLTVTLNYLFNGVSGLLYGDYFKPDPRYDCPHVEDEWWMGYYDGGFGSKTITLPNGRDEYDDGEYAIPRSELDDENLDHLPADYWEGKELP